MTTRQLPEAYLNLRQPDIDAEPDVSLHATEEHGPTVVIYLGRTVNMHVKTARQARALADAFTKAARLLDEAEPAPRADGSIPDPGPQDGAS